VSYFGLISAGLGEMNLGYAGDLSPDDSFKLLRDDSSARLVDVRTDAEWNYVGLPNLSPDARDVVLLSWQLFPSMEVNPVFIAQLMELVPDQSAPVMFLCRSGVRSRSAAVAATSAGYGSAFNVAGGFEGDKDPNGHRGLINGWKAIGLPWVQG
jgi:rhodanese-related sulfurtransferase